MRCGLPPSLGPPHQLNLMEGGSGHLSQQALERRSPLPESELSFPGLARGSRASSQAPSWAGTAVPPRSWGCPPPLHTDHKGCWEHTSAPEAHSTPVRQTPTFSRQVDLFYPSMPIRQPLGSAVPTESKSDISKPSEDCQSLGPFKPGHCGYPLKRCVWEPRALSGKPHETLTAVLKSPVSPEKQRGG